MAASCSQHAPLPSPSLSSRILATFDRVQSADYIKTWVFSGLHQTCFCTQPVHTRNHQSKPVTSNSPNSPSQAANQDHNKMSSSSKLIFASFALLCLLVLVGNSASQPVPSPAPNQGGASSSVTPQVSTTPAPTTDPNASTTPNPKPNSNGADGSLSPTILALIIVAGVVVGVGIIGFLCSRYYRKSGQANL